MQLAMTVFAVVLGAAVVLGVVGYLIDNRDFGRGRSEGR